MLEGEIKSLMTLPTAALEFLYNNARAANVPLPQANDDLYKMGILNSLEVAELVSILEENCDIKILDVDVNSSNFQSISAIERYVESLMS